MRKIYIAGGWFSPPQFTALSIVLNACERIGINVFSPKDDLLYKDDGSMDPNDVFDENLKQIRESDFVLASTEGKDMGTLFECGYAYSQGIPVIYFWMGGSGTFNLMLAMSATAVLTNVADLNCYLVEYKNTCNIRTIPYKGGIE